MTRTPGNILMMVGLMAIASLMGALGCESAEQRPVYRVVGRDPSLTPATRPYLASDAGPAPGLGFNGSQQWANHTNGAMPSPAGGTRVGARALEVTGRPEPYNAPTAQTTAYRPLPAAEPPAGPGGPRDSNFMGPMPEPAAVSPASLRRSNGQVLQAMPVSQRSPDGSALASLSVSGVQVQESGELSAEDERALNVYHVGPGDVLEIRIHQLEDLNRETRVEATVDDAGRVQLPVLGSVAVGGQTVEQVRENLRVRLATEFMREPRVQVAVQEYRSKEVLVLGAVGREGPAALTTDATRLMALIGKLGGITDNNAGNVLIIRGGAGRLPTASGGPDNLDVWLAAAREDQDCQVIDIPIVRLMGDEGWRFNPVVRPGDVIYVPKGRDGQYYVTGSVNRPGAWPLQRPMNLLQGVVAAGDTTRIAAEDRCKVIRTTPEGEEIVLAVNLKKVRSGEQENLILQRNDVVVVPVDPVLAFFDAVDRMFQRGVRVGVNATYDAASDMGIPATNY